MRRVDNFLRTTHWIAECSVFAIDGGAQQVVHRADLEYLCARLIAETHAIRGLTEINLEEDFLWWVQWWIDRIDTETIRVPCNGGVF
jgi:hypothetical protein